jgi:hypothetical protein
MAVHQRDLPPEDFPMAIYVHTDPRDVPASCVWAVTILRPPPGVRVPLYIPSFRQHGPVWVTTISGEGASATTGPYSEESTA